MGSIRARDIIISIFVVGLITLSMFTMTAGITEVYSTEEVDDRIENSLQNNQNVIDNVTAMQEELQDEDNGFLETVFIVLFKGFKIFVLSLVAVFSNATTMVTTVGEYFGLGTAATYISLIIVITIIATIWRALQGREGV